MRAVQILGSKRPYQRPDVKSRLELYGRTAAASPSFGGVGEPHLYISQVAAGQDHLTAPRRLNLEEGRDLPYTWTADSKSLVFISDREGPFHLFKQGIRPGCARSAGGRLEHGYDRQAQPRWLRNSVSLDADTNDPAGQVRVMRMPVNGAQPQLLLHKNRLWKHTMRAGLPSKLCLFSRNERTPSASFSFDSKAARSAN